MDLLCIRPYVSFVLIENVSMMLEAITPIVKNIADSCHEKQNKKDMLNNSAVSKYG